MNGEREHEAMRKKRVMSNAPSVVSAKRPSSLLRHGWLSGLLKWGLALALALVVLVGAFRMLIFTDVFHALEHRRLRTAQHFTQADPLSVVHQLQDYFRRPGVELIDHDLFSYRERLHYREVKQLIDRAQAAGAWALPVVFVVAFSLMAIDHRAPEPRSRMAAIVCTETAIILVGMLVLGGVFALNFDANFVWLHRHLFDSQNWLLAPYAASVQLFPGPYFTDFLWAYLAVILVVISLLLVIAQRLSRNSLIPLPSRP